MPEIIQSIEEVESEVAGFRITTSAQEISILISNYSNCCEMWGHLALNDNIQDFIGAEYLGMDIVEEDLTRREVLPDLDEGDAVFVDIRTNRGVLQFAVYNAHNGYYGHRVTITSNELQLDRYV